MFIILQLLQLIQYLFIKNIMVFFDQNICYVCWYNVWMNDKPHVNVRISYLNKM